MIYFLRMLYELVNESKRFFDCFTKLVTGVSNQIFKHFERDSTMTLKLQDGREIGKEALITCSTRELVEFYWTNRKRFSGGYKGFPSESIQKIREINKLM